MCGEQREVDVYETPRFKKAFKKLNDKAQGIVDDEIEKIIRDPEIGDQKAGDLDHLRVHKFNISRAEYLLGYNWNEGIVTVYLLQLGTHENYYRDAKKNRKGDIKSVY